MSAKQEEERGEGDVMCQSDKKNFLKGYKKKKNMESYIHRGEGDREGEGKGERQREGGV